LKADVELVRKVFSKFDINSDGRIEAKELKTAMKELIGKEASDEEIAEMVFNKKSKYIYLVCYSIN
jgi:Ca2+-binding EF-hand superfamily protein